jgi:hypothetical protein
MDWIVVPKRKAKRQQIKEEKRTNQDGRKWHHLIKENLNQQKFGKGLLG